ncbi:hypothetical protein [Actinopolyspora mortivallis]|uniref:hypothetical protein n=1 Tax=Actinopolyspora mortivallis TaxID=33906 RepID=UPI0011B23746|nr:hypothetical protein [Actinopolyspora mortivallis]
MSAPARVLFLIGALALVVTLVAAVAPGPDYLAWIAGTVGALAVAGGFVARALASDLDEDSGDRRPVPRRPRGTVFGGGSGTSLLERARQRRRSATTGTSPSGTGSAETDEVDRSLG